MLSNSLRVGVSFPSLTRVKRDVLPCLKKRISRCEIHFAQPEIKHHDLFLFRQNVWRFDMFFFLSHRTSTSWNRVIFPFRKKMIFFFAKINGDLIFLCALLAAIFTVFSLRFMAIFILPFLAVAWQFFPLVPIDSPIVLLHFFVQEIGFVCTG